MSQQTNKQTNKQTQIQTNEQLNKSKNTQTNLHNDHVHCIRDIRHVPPNPVTESSSTYQSMQSFLEGGKTNRIAL